MKNKGRRHKAPSGNCKGWLSHITRSITKMSNEDKHITQGYSKKFYKRKWSKRVRGYFKSQIKNLGQIIEDGTQ